MAQLRSKTGCIAYLRALVKLLVLAGDQLGLLGSELVAKVLDILLDLRLTLSSGLELVLCGL